MNRGRKRSFNTCLVTNAGLFFLFSRNAEGSKGGEKFPTGILEKSAEMMQNNDARIAETFGKSDK